MTTLRLMQADPPLPWTAVSQNEQMRSPLGIVPDDMSPRLLVCATLFLYRQLGGGMARISRRLSIALGIVLGAIVGLPAVATADIWVVTRDTKQVCARVPSDNTIIFFVGEC
jgi:hypothetical protein